MCKKNAAMEPILKQLPFFVDQVKAIKETVISNIVLLGQTPAPTFGESARAEVFLERLADAYVDHCATDDFSNPVGIVKGRSGGAKPPIFVVAHIDSAFSPEIDHNYVIRKNAIVGPGIVDNAAGVGVLATLPIILRHLDLHLDSDVVISGVTQSIGRGNLKGIRNLLTHWEGPIRGGVIVEGEKLGRLNYYSEGIIRGEIRCNISAANQWALKHKPNAILILNEVINEILAMNLPQRPRSRVIIGKINGGFKHGLIAQDAQLGFEIQSDSDEMVQHMFDEIQDIVDGIGHEHSVDLQLHIISNQIAATMKYRHPLVKSAVGIMKRLGLKPVSESSESELSIFLANQIPAVTLGLTTGRNVHLENAAMRIDPMFTGIAQVIGVLMAIDSGVCDDV
ncbi:MAG: peptidase dimerization domain-containing protein [Thermodesulfobacteriota bacterium]